jgi:hypothetical protein
MKFDINEKIKSVTPGKVIGAIIILAVILGIFQAGVFVGFSKASFHYNFGDNYYRNFGQPGGRMERSMMKPLNDIGMRLMDERSGGHGTFGKIIKINLPNIVVLGPDNIEKIVLINSTTTIHMGRTQVVTDNLIMDQDIVVLGTPNESGEISANFIRIMPPRK